MLVRRTGQTSCFNAAGKPVACTATGQDAETTSGRSWPKPRFEAQGKGARDRLTGLTWLTDASITQFPLPWEEARKFCSGLRTEGRSWRLPSRRELWSLVSFEAANPALPQAHPFSRVFPGWYWSATASALTPGYHWRVQLSGGRMFHGAPGDPCMVWPVSGSCQDLEPDTKFPRFVAQGEAEVHDTATGLVWHGRADLCDGVLWQQALDAVRALRDETGKAWRLPTITELETLAELKHAFPALPPGHPFTALREVYWSSTSSAFEPDWSMAYYQHKGAVGVGFKAGPQAFHVWPVRAANEEHGSKH